MSRLTIHELNQQLLNLTDWDRFAIHLPLISQEEIKIIREDKTLDDVAQKLALFKKWLQVYPNASWDTVVLALEKIDENFLAQEIRIKHQVNVS